MQFNKHNIHQPNPIINGSPDNYSILGRFSKKIIILIVLLAFADSGCKKLVEIPPPTSSITSSQVFSTDNLATSAVANIYSKMINGSGVAFIRSAITIYGGASSDEFLFFDQTNVNNVQFQNNDLSSSNAVVLGQFWTNAYSYIYAANAVLDGLAASTKVHEQVKTELTGEAKFIRALCNFYLTNFFGDIPLVETTNYTKTSLIGRTPSSDVYNAIIKDLQDAQTELPADYSVSLGQRIVPNKWTATALLARVYLYLGQFTSAEAQATAIINNSSLYSLCADLNNVFLANSTEAIWQLQQNNANLPYNATPEGYQIIPRNATTKPTIYLTPQLLNAFEIEDKRKSAWIASTTFSGNTYFYPYKYKLGPNEAKINGAYTEYYTLFRLAEQYLIRAESRAQLGENNATDDLNKIRNRAGLENYSGATDKSSLLVAIAHERQMELFAELGHRWLDLKRTQRVSSVLKPIKALWTPDDQLYPIPVGELTTDPNLTQNPGY